MLTKCRECPRCQYDLTGLPEKHTCPECGLEYDPHAVYVRLSLHTRPWNQVVMGVALIAAAVFFPRPGLRWKENLPLILLIIVAMLPAILRLLTSSGKGYLILNRSGFAMVDDRMRTTTIAWHELRGVRCNWITGNLVVMGPSSTGLVFPSWQFDGFFNARRLAREIRQLKEVYIDQAHQNAQ